MTKGIKIGLLLVLFLILLLALYLLLGGSRELRGDGIHFIREERQMSMKKRTECPPVCLFGGGGENVPADRETRRVEAGAEKGNRGQQYGTF